MRSHADRQRVAALFASGLNDCEIERLTGIPRRTVSDWRHGRRGRAARAAASCDVCGGTPERLSAASYAYLLGAYLGDGYVVRPQHGVGRKHTRQIALAPWQQRIVDAQPGQLVRGLIHSDGWRGVNRVRHPKRTYEYVRYQFTNRSDDIRHIFCDACDALGIEWRVMKSDTISVARRDSVARLDAFVGAKR
jgi:hypothetical protein